MIRIIVAFLIFCTVPATVYSQRSPTAIADSALTLIGDGNGFSPREQLRGQVASYEISGKLATEADYMVQLLLVHIWGFGDLPEVKTEPQIPGPYYPLVKVGFAPDGALASASVSFNGETRKLPQYNDQTTKKEDFFHYKYSGDTVIAESKNGDKMPWVILRFLRNGQVLNAKSKVESDVIFYDEYIFSNPKPEKHVIDHYTQAVVYNDHAEATYLPDTPGVTLRNKYKPEAPDKHALRKRVLEDRVVIQQTPDGYTRSYYKDGNADDPSSIAKVNKHGLLTETTVKYYSAVLVQLTYEYDQQGNWIKCMPAFPEEREMKNCTPLLRKINYR